MENNVLENIESIKSECLMDIQIGGNMSSPQTILIIIITLLVLFFILKWIVDYFLSGVDTKINDFEKKVDEIGKRKIDNISSNLKKMIGIERPTIYSESNQVLKDLKKIQPILTDPEKNEINYIQPENLDNIKADTLMSSILQSTKMGLNNL